MKAEQEIWSARCRIVARLVSAAAVVCALVLQGISPAMAGVLPGDDGSRPAEDPVLKGLHGMGKPADSLGFTPGTNQEDFDVTHYKLQLTFEPVTEIVSGTVTITGQSLLPSLTSVDLDFYNNMAISQVVTGATPLTFSRANNVLSINLDRTYGVSEVWEVAVTYSGHPSPAGGFTSFNWTVKTPGKVIWSLSEPEGARTWWPCKDRPDDKATAEMIFTVPSSSVATSNGLLTSVTTDTGAGTKTYTWVESYPITTYLVSITAWGFTSFSHTYVPIGGGSMPVDYYVYPADLAKAQNSFSNTVSMIEFFAETFGEYPFVTQKYGMTECPFGGGMEHQANTSYGQTLVNNTHQYDYIIAHELSHQWWGDAVSPRIWADIWLNEGFASYSEALWTENISGAAAYRNYMNTRFFHTTWGLSLYNPANLFGYTVYHKGAWVQHMLRHIVGDVAFFQAQRNWYENHKYSFGDTAGYQAEVEAAAGIGSLAWFFNEWVYGPGMPNYYWTWSVADTGNGYDLWLRIDQGQATAPAFKMPIDIDVTTPSGTTRVVVDNEETTQDYRIHFTEAPTAVAFDPQDWILKTRTLAPVEDLDWDGVPDRNDNCPEVVNGSQADLDQDSSGDECDDDDDGDQILDADDCAPLDPGGGRPFEVPAITVTRTQVAWSAAPGAERYDVSRGLLSAIQVGEYGPCLADSVTLASVPDAALPPAGDGFLYLVRGVDDVCGGPGSWGNASNGVERVNGNPLACP